MSEWSDASGVKQRGDYASRPPSKRYYGEDLDGQLDFYEQEAGLDVALRFLTAVEEAIQFLYRYPEAGALKELENSRLNGLRSWLVSGFEAIRIYYLRPDEHTLRIVRILHGKRDLDRILEKEEG